MQRLLQLFLGLLMTVAVSGITCVQLNSHNHCIHKGPDERSWEMSEAYCESRSGHLTSIHNQKDIAAIKGNWGTGDCTKARCFVCETSMVMSDCADWYKAGYRELIAFSSDGVYSIVVNDKPYNVFCDMTTAGGGWLVFQRRVNDSDPFWDHTWAEYRNGFGKLGPNTTFWLGNEVLHQLTYKDPSVTLRVEMRGDRTQNSKNPKGYWWNHYFKFRVGSEETDYTLERLYMDRRKIQGNASTGW
ncbi:unnamed protein product [Haemonchus placei]|uniref:Fibrinogen C-terminal domain-containing protein n=1 Tax=Haemonchus placei TaxID=6290 RepID=A0A0N4WA97_HAEPC|nr:unnamed protein product [Haemonchus placei]